MVAWDTILTCPDNSGFLAWKLGKEIVNISLKDTGG